MNWWKIFGQCLADLRDSGDDAFGELSLLQQITHSGSDVVPQGLATFFMHADVAPNGKLVCERGEINQHRVALARLGHGELVKASSSRDQNVLPFLVRDVHADLPGRFALGLRDGRNDLRFVQSLDELLGLHAPLPTATGSAPA